MRALEVRLVSFADECHADMAALRASVQACLVPKDGAHLQAREEAAEAALQRARYN